MLISIDEKDRKPLYEQIRTQLKEQIALGSLAPGESLPGVRELAEALDVNLHTVHKAYQLLRDEGAIELRLGRRARVSAPREKASKKEVEEKVVGRLRDTITEARMLGLDISEFQGLVQKIWA